MFTNRGQKRQNHNMYIYVSYKFLHVRLIHDRCHQLFGTGELFYVLRGLVILIDFRIRTSFKLTLWAILTFSGGKLSRSWVRLSILSSILFRSSIVKISGSTSPTQSTKMSRTCLSSSTKLENYFRAWVLMKKYLKPFYYWGSSWVWFVALRKRIKIRGKLQKIFFYPHVRFYFFNFRAYFSLFSFCNNQFFST